MLVNYRLQLTSIFNTKFIFNCYSAVIQSIQIDACVSPKQSLVPCHKWIRSKESLVKNIYIKSQFIEIFRRSFSTSGPLFSVLNYRIQQTLTRFETVQIASPIMNWPCQIVTSANCIQKRRHSKNAKYLLVLNWNQMTLNEAGESLRQWPEVFKNNI